MELLDQLINAASKNDKRAMEYLGNNGCLISTKAGIPITILNTNWTGGAHVRVYLDDGNSIELWTPLENLARDFKNTQQ